MGAGCPRATAALGDWPAYKNQYKEPHPMTPEALARLTAARATAAAIRAAEAAATVASRRATKAKKRAENIVFLFTSAA